MAYYYYVPSRDTVIKEDRPRNIPSWKPISEREYRERLKKAKERHKKKRRKSVEPKPVPSLTPSDVINTLNKELEKMPEKSRKALLKSLKSPKEGTVQYVKTPQGYARIKYQGGKWYFYPPKSKTPTFELNLKFEEIKKVPKTEAKDKKLARFLEEKAQTLKRKLELEKSKPTLPFHLQHPSLTVSEEQFRAIERSQERARLKSYVPVKETMEVYPPERLVIEAKEIEEGGQKKTEYTLDTSFKYRSKFEKIQDEIEKTWEQEPKHVQVARQMVGLIGTSSPIVTIGKTLSPITTTKEKLTGVFQTAMWGLPLTAPAEVLPMVSATFGTIGLKSSLPKALEGDPTAIAESLLSGGALISGIYGIYKTFSKPETKVLLKTETKDSKLFLKDKELIEASELRMKGQVLQRTRFDKLLRRGWKTVDTIEGGGRILVSSKEGVIKGYGVTDFWTKETGGRAFSRFLAKLGKEQIKALTEGKPIHFRSQELTLADVIYKGEITRDISFRSYQHTLLEAWKLKTETLELSRYAGITKRPFELRFIKPIEREASILTKMRPSLDVSYEKLNLAGLTKTRAITEITETESLGVHVSDVIKFKSIGFERGLETGSLETATKTMQKSLAQTVKEIYGSTVKVTAPQLKHPIVIKTPTTKEKKERVKLEIKEDQVKVSIRQQQKIAQLPRLSEGVTKALKREEKDLEKIKYISRVSTGVDVVRKTRRRERIKERIFPKEIEKIEEKIKIDERELEKTKTSPDIPRISIEITPYTTYIPPYVVTTPKLPLTRYDILPYVPEKISISRGFKERETTYIPSFVAIEFDIEKELKGLEKEFSTGLELRPIPRRKSKRRKKKKKRR